MILRILGSPWALVAAWIIGPAILIAIHRRNKRLAEQQEKGGRKGAASAAPARDTDPGTGSGRAPGATPIPGRQEVVPGFRDLRWGDAPTQAMTLVSQNAAEAVYALPGDLLRVEDVPVETIHYIFSDGKFAAVRIDAPLHAGDPLLRALSQHWGFPDTSDPRALKQQWTHLVSGALATAAVLEKNPVSRRATLFLFRKLPAVPAR